MYSMDLFTKCQIQMDWNDLLWGVTKAFVDVRLVSKFAEKAIVDNGDNDIAEIYDLAWNATDKEEVLRLIKIAMKKLNVMIAVENASRRWRYCIIKNLREYENEPSNLFDKIENLYADFDYPVDMIEFIRYMPPLDSYDPNIHSDEENEKRMLRKLDDFLVVELNAIKSIQLL